VKRFIQNNDVTIRDQDTWVIDFSDYPNKAEAALFQAPFEKLKKEVERHRAGMAVSRASEVERLEKFWLMQRPRPQLRAAASGLAEIIVVPETSEHLIFRFVPADAVISGSLFAICTESRAVFGVLCSRFHRVWARLQGNRLGVGNQSRYNATRTFQTFPFPEGFGPSAVDDRASRVADVASAARQLEQHRNNWLSPPSGDARIAEGPLNHPESTVARSQKSLTTLYNEMPQWLAEDQRALDAAVARAYGWSPEIPDGEAITHLLASNRS